MHKQFPSYVYRDHLIAGASSVDLLINARLIVDPRAVCGARQRANRSIDLSIRRAANRGPSLTGIIKRHAVCTHVRFDIEQCEIPRPDWTARCRRDPREKEERYRDKRTKREREREIRRAVVDTRHKGSREWASCFRKWKQGDACNSCLPFHPVWEGTDKFGRKRDGN